MKKIFLLILLISNYTFSQTEIKTYYDPLFQTKLKEVYQVKNNTPILNGYYKKYDNYGYLLISKNFTNNKSNGKSTTYYGANEASLMYNNAREKCLGEISGIFNYKNDNLDGVQLNYDYTKAGNRFLRKKEIYTNGEMVEHIEYFPNKQIKVHNKINGECFGYFENGNKFDNFFLKNGKYEGVYTGWFESGIIQTKGSFINDEKEGEWIEYNEVGSIKSKETFKLGNKLPSVEEKQAELDKIKRLEKDRISYKEESILNELKSNYLFELQVIESNYKYYDGDYIKFKKPILYGAFTKIKNLTLEYLEYKNISNQEKIESIKIAQELNKKVKQLLYKSTSKLERELGKVEDILDIINLFELEN